MKCEVFKKLINSLLFGVLIFYTHSGFAQTICSFDTLNWPLAGNDTLYSSEPLGSPGYVSGHNGYIQPSTAEFISNSDTISVTGALIRFGHAETADSTSIITISIWDRSGIDHNGDAGAPGNILISKDILITDIVNDVNNAVLTEITFDSSITLTEGFYLGMQVTLLPDTTNVPGDTVAIITNTDGETVPATAWAEYPFFNGWWNFQPSWFLDISLAIFPITCTLITGINEQIDLAPLTIFPNPTEGLINIMFNAHELQPTSIKVYDLRGSLTSETTHDLMTGYCTIDLSKQAGGIYLVQLVTRNGVISQKVSVVEK